MVGAATPLGYYGHREAVESGPALARKAGEVTADTLSLLGAIHEEVPNEAAAVPGNRRPARSPQPPSLIPQTVRISPLGHIVGFRERGLRRLRSSRAMVSHPSERMRIRRAQESHPDGVEPRVT